MATAAEDSKKVQFTPETTFDRSDTLGSTPSRPLVPASSSPGSQIHEQSSYMQTKLSKGKEVEFITAENEEQVIEMVAGYLQRISNSFLDRYEGDFTIGLSGGSMIKFLAKALVLVETEWARWKVFFCDERVVPFDSVDSIFGQYREMLKGVVPLTEKQFVPIIPYFKVEKAAEDYENKMRAYFGEPESGFPEFDLLMLGIGPDGHTASLFPDHILLQEQTRWIAWIDNSPKPPPERITMTLPVINNARNVFVMATGPAKLGIVKKLFEHDRSIPIGLVRPKGTLTFLLDREAMNTVLEADAVTILSGSLNSKGSSESHSGELIVQAYI